jgi:hypothetical protein
MELPRVSASTGARGRGVCLRVVVAVFTILVLPAQGRALNADLRWTASTDPRVQGYNVYVREATHPHGAPRNAGAPHVDGDGSVSWQLTGLVTSTTYFVAVTAYTDTGLESALSNELPIGTPNPCVRDQCTSLTQCILQTLPDGSSCGPAGAACGATCLAGVCAGLADRVMTIDRLRVKAARGDLKIMAKGSFVTSAVFDPMATGLQLTLADPNGAALVQTTLTPADLLASRDGGTIKSASRRGAADAGPVKRLLFRKRDDVTKWKAQLAVSPAPAGLPSGMTVAIQAGTLCVSAEATGCEVRARALTCR